MRKRTMALGAAALALGLPVAVLAGGTSYYGENVITLDPEQAAWATGAPVETGSREFRPIRGIPQGEGVDIDFNSPSPVYVSVDLKAGKAKLRIVDAGGDPSVPSSVTLAGPGVTTATFANFVDGFEDPVLEWKRVGRDRVVARSVVASTIGELD